MPDPIDYAQLAPGIRETVRWLADCGFGPCDSGDGVTNPAAGMECAVDYPHVHMFVGHERLVSECRRLHALLSAVGIVVRDPTLTGLMPPCIEANYSAGSGIATISLCGVDDAMLLPLIAAKESV